MDILTDEEVMLRAGIKIVLGAVLGGPPLDARFPRGLLTAVDTSGENREATFEDLGSRVEVIFVSPEDLQ